MLPHHGLTTHRCPPRQALTRIAPGRMPRRRPHRTAISQVCANGLCTARKQRLNPNDTAYVPECAVAMGQRRRERTTSAWFCHEPLGERPMTQQNEHRDRVSKAVFDTGYNYGAIHKQYLAAAGQPRRPRQRPAAGDTAGCRAGRRPLPVGRSRPPACGRSGIGSSGLH